MTREGAALVMAAVAALLITAGLIAWFRRSRRDAAIAAPVGEIPDGARETLRSEGLYVATTRHDEPLERLAIRGLAFRSRADVTVTDRGVALDLTGQPRVFLAASAIGSVGQATVAIDRVVERDGLVRLVWTAPGGQTVDSYLRPQDVSARRLADTIQAVLPSPSSPQQTPGSDA
ncbi:hypothetical protein KZX37_12155 [Microbacterium sp. EYE_5]|uniref:PH-like domain-containing protein n=1 Tax=unclassified Microbacterium TaxID=2609290 RepID=UPI00200576CE|nr:MULTISPECIES: hypothetical protein [unclassified Microbacterium]MCK6080734.1 hypothetical protein [Microbacterium sp. EYE_382]MCK6086005.1 hypothetical protein [Microbacterium sp. EYE_384]MCK6124497.1 hypothetical protein [Microbacterium sp. EYE_80]MCK6127406.1 hypothetical protein [Microbacterium sp. EYE_79]MCK6141689.1 hypothetical protein [Microbacterium sp. EYE_39]